MIGDEAQNWQQYTENGTNSWRMHAVTHAVSHLRCVHCSAFLAVRAVLAYMLQLPVLSFVADLVTVHHVYVYLSIFNFYRAMLAQSAVMRLLSSVCPSVCLSVR